VPKRKNIMSRIYYYVVSHPTAGWQLSLEGGKEATFYKTKEEAVQAGRRIARSRGERNRENTGLRIGLANGQWQEERSYGDDPFPPKG
jgi:hypothetical protein